MSRVKLVFRDLGAADAIAGVDHRYTENLGSILSDVAHRFADGVNIETLAIPALNAYARAYRNAKHHPERALFTTNGCTPDEIDCRACSTAFPKARTATHVVNIGHLIRSEAEPRRKVYSE